MARTDNNRDYATIVRMLTHRAIRNKGIIERAQRDIATRQEIGTLVIRKRGNGVQYFHRLCRKKEQYLKPGNPLITTLALSDYNKRILRIAQDENKWIDRTLESMPTKSIENVYADDKVRRSLIEPVYITDEEFIAKWQSKDYVKKPIKEIDRIKTDRGDYVRSKSEALIANMLYRLGVPYRYEYPIVLKNGITIYADFTILDIKKRKDYVFEHFGMMDDQGYEEKFMRKIKTYSDNGIIIGDRLIVSFEDSKTKLDIGGLEKQLRLILELTN